MSQYDFLNYLKQCDRRELLKMTSALLTDEWKKHMVLSQPEPILMEIKSHLNLSPDYEVGERVNELSPTALMDVIEAKLPSAFLIDELNSLSHETKDAVISIKKSEEKKSLTEKIKKFFTDNFTIKINGKIATDSLPKKINIREVHGSSVVFDFYVKKGEQEITYKGNKLHEANHFFLLWLGDFMGFDDSERFRQLFAINATSLVPFMDELYLYDSIFWDGTEVCGVLNNQGDIILPSKFSQIERVGISNNFKAYRLKLHGEIDGEGWEYYNLEGNRVKGEVVNGEFDEKYEKDLHNRYEFAKSAVWTRDELEEMNAIGQRKYSKWCISLDLLPELTSNFLIDYKSLHRNPNTKYYLVKDLYVCFAKLGTKELFGIGIDPDMNVEFKPDEE